MLTCPSKFFSFFFFFFDYLFYLEELEERPSICWLMSQMALTTTKPAALCRSSKWAEGIQVAELSSAFPGAHWQVAVTGSRARHLDSGCRNIKQALNCCSTCPPHLYSFFSQKSGLLWFECWFPLQILMSSPDIERWTARVGALTEEVSECVLAFSIN